MENTFNTSDNQLDKIISVSAGHFFNDFYVALIPQILFLFASKLSLNMIQQATIAAVISSSGSFGQPLVGILIDRKGEA
jgi:hypothetical protein